MCKRHKWVREGGCRENPGFWGIGGSAIQINEVCPKCGATRNRVFGDVDRPSRNHGWRVTQGH